MITVDCFLTVSDLIAVAFVSKKIFIYVFLRIQKCKNFNFSFEWTEVFILLVIDFRAFAKHFISNSILQLHCAANDCILTLKFFHSPHLHFPGNSARRRSCFNWGAFASTTRFLFRCSFFYWKSSQMERLRWRILRRQFFAITKIPSWHHGMAWKFHHGIYVDRREW